MLRNTSSWAPMAHIYNPSYSGGRDQEGHGSKPVQANSSRYPISKIARAKWTGDVAQEAVYALQVENPEFKPQSHHPKKKKRKT
jgi:hypothetical protein